MDRFQEDLYRGSVSERAKPQRLEEVDTPSHHVMNCSMRPSFKRALESNEIPHKPVYYGFLTLRRDQGHQGQVGQSGKGWCILATELVGRGIRDRETICESTAGDFIVVVGVTPTPDAAGGIGVPETAVRKVKCVCHTAN